MAAFMERGQGGVWNGGRAAYGTGAFLPRLKARQRLVCRALAALAAFGGGRGGLWNGGIPAPA